MSESDEPINSDSASEDEKNGTEECETSDDQYLSDFTRLQPYVYEPSVSKESVKKKTAGKRNTSRIGNTFWCFCGKCKPVATHSESIC